MIKLGDEEAVDKMDNAIGGMSLVEDEDGPGGSGMMR